MRANEDKGMNPELQKRAEEWRTQLLAEAELSGISPLTPSAGLAIRTHMHGTRAMSECQDLPTSLH